MPPTEHPDGLPRSVITEPKLLDASRTNGRTELSGTNLAEIEAIVNNSEEPTFINTIEALEKSGELLEKVDRLFSCINDAETNDEMQAISEKVEPLLTKHNDDISLNPELFARVEKIYEQR